MKKGLKIVGVVLAGIVVLVAIAVALALMPSVQTWAVRKAVAGQPGMEIHVSRVAAGFSAADVNDLRFVKDGMVITAKGVTAHYSAWDYISSKRINVDSATINELVIDLRNAKPSPAATGTSAPSPTTSTPSAPRTSAPVASSEKKAPFEGLLKQAQLPFDVRVAALSAKGRALLPNNQIVTFDLKGSGIETGQRGKLEWTIDFADSTAGAALRALRATGNANVLIAADRRIASVEMETVVAAMGPKLSAEPIRVMAKADKPAPAGDETYAASVSLVKGNALEPLVKTNAQFLSASREIAGSWDLAVRTEQLAGLLAGLGLPELSAKGAGKFNFKPDTNAVAASGDLDARTAQLQKFMPELAAVGSIQLTAAFDGGMADNVARLDKLNLEIAGSDGRKFAQISSLQKINYQLTDKRVTLANPKAELARISLQAIPLAWAQAFVKPMVVESGDLSMVLAVEAEPDGSRVRARTVEPLAVRTVTVRQGDKKLADRVTLTVKPTVDYSATKLSAQLAELSITVPAGDAVSGSFSADVTNLARTPAVAFSGQIQAKVVTLLKPYLPIDLGPLAINTALEGRHEGQMLNLAKTTVTVNRDGGALLTGIELQQPIQADLKASKFTVPNPSATAARIKLGELPLAMAEAFVPKSKFGGTLKGATLEVAMRSVDDVTLTTAEPLTLAGVTVSMDGKPMLQNVDLLANLTATKRGETIAYEVKKVEVKQGQASLAALNVAGEAKLGAKMAVAAKGNLEADPVALMAQPVLAPYATLSRGKFAAAFDASLGDAIEAKAAISAKGLVAKQDNRALGDLEVNLNATMKSDGSGTVTAPITMTNANRKSDVSITGAFGKSANKETFLFTGKIASNNLVVDDFQPLAALAPASEPAKPAPSTTPRPTVPPRGSPPARDTVPFWKGVNGKVELDLKQVQYGKDYTISPIRGSAVITDSKISLEGLEGRFKENPFKVAATVTFAAQQAQPYSMVGSADVTNFDVGAFLRAANPNEKPALETKATLSAKLNGQGGTVGELGKNAFGKFELTGTEGTMYLLERKGTAGAIVNIGSAVAGLLGSGLIGKSGGSDTAAALSEIAKLLNSVHFDSIKLQVERAQDLSFKLTSLEVLSPILRMTGTGAVASKGTEDLQNAPMNIVLQLGAKNELGYLLQRVNMLGQTKDEKGYQIMSRTFTVGGTPSKPDSSSLWKILGEAAAGALLR